MTYYPCDVIIQKRWNNESWQTTSTEDILNYWYTLMSIWVSSVRNVTFEMKVAKYHTRNMNDVVRAKYMTCDMDYKMAITNIFKYFHEGASGNICQEVTCVLKILNIYLNGTIYFMCHQKELFHVLSLIEQIMNYGINWLIHAHTHAYI